MENKCKHEFLSGNSGECQLCHNWVESTPDKCAFCDKELESGQTAIKRLYHPKCDPKFGPLNPSSNQNSSTPDKWEEEYKRTFIQCKNKKMSYASVEYMIIDFIRNLLKSEWESIKDEIETLHRVNKGLAEALASQKQDLISVIEGMDKKLLPGSMKTKAYAWGQIYNEALRDVINKLKIK